MSSRLVAALAALSLMGCGRSSLLPGSRDRDEHEVGGDATSAPATSTSTSTSTSIVVGSTAGPAGPGGFGGADVATAVTVTTGPGSGGFGGDPQGPGPTSVSSSSVVSSSSGPVSFCGDGVIDPGEACDLGAGNAYRPALLVEQGTGLEGAFEPLLVDDVVAFYDYFSASSHTGFEAQNASLMYFVQDAGGALHLVVHTGIDQSTTGISQPPGNAKLALEGLPVETFVSVSDEANEFLKTGPTSAAGSWTFNDNTDGGVVSGFPFPGSWVVTARASFSKNIQAWEYLFDDGGQPTSAPLDQALEVRFTAFATPAACRLDCSLPACGDGIVDGGELCDDGGDPTSPCAADCKSFQ